jgi:transcriptional regulator with XRE-family HTH domain
MSTFCEKIRKLRESKNLTTRMLAELLGVSNGQISKYETGKHEPNMRILKKYKEIFGVSLDYLCDDESE